MRAVVSFADTDFYQQKMKRLRDSVEAQGIKFVGYTSCEEVGCKPHSVIPYQFKPYAIHKALEEGVTTLLWLDSPVVAIKDLSPVFEHIEKFGYLFFDNVGHGLGKWTNDKCLNYFGITREESMEIRMIMACAMGFRLQFFGHPKHSNFSIFPKWLDEYRNLSDHLYPGLWSNHRHDQSVISCLIHKYKLDIMTAHETFFMYEHFKEVFTIAPSVCLVSR